MSGFDLDAMPSRKQLQLLWRLKAGDRVVVTTRGNGYRSERTGTSVPKPLAESVFKNQWAWRPSVDGPLFDHDEDGRLTPRGAAPIDRYHQHVRASLIRVLR